MIYVWPMYRRFKDGVYGSMAYSQILYILLLGECERNSLAFSRASLVFVNRPSAPVSDFTASLKRPYLGYMYMVLHRLGPSYPQDIFPSKLEQDKS